MLENILHNFCIMMVIVGCVTIITFLICLIINTITITIDLYQKKRIKDKLLRELHKKLDSTIQDMDKQAIDKNNKE